MKLLRFVTITIIVTFLAAAFTPVAAANAQGGLRGVPVPVLVSPHGTILDTTPTYKWKVVTGATMYQYQVYRGTTKVLDKTPDSGICGAGYCEKAPTFTLTQNTYQWRVKAYKGGVWSAWSAYMVFTVSAPSFNSQFNTNMNGWAKRAGGEWVIKDSKYLYTEGSTGKFTTVYRTASQYTDFDYSARIYRFGSDKPSYLAVRAGPLLISSSLEWGPGYIFGITNDGEFAVMRSLSNGTHVVIQDWTATTAIAQYGWNVLRVVAKGSSFWFYINGTMVKSFTDSSISKGSVGLMTFKQVAAEGSFYVDWAKLTVVETP